MPMTPLLILGGVVTARMLYTYGGEGIKNFFDKIIGMFKNMISFAAQGTKAGPEYTDRKLKEIEKEEAQKTEEVGKESPKIEVEEEDIAKRADAVKAKQETVEAFVPGNWEKLGAEEREAAVNRLAADLADSMSLSREYQIGFCDLGGSEVPITAAQDGGHVQILFDKSLYMEGSDASAPIKLYNSIVREMAYNRQEEVKEGLAQPTSKEQAIQEAVTHNISNIPEDINVPKTFFLNNRINPIKNATGLSYISAPPGTSTYERQAIALLQPAERVPSMMVNIHYEQLKNAIKEKGDIPAEAEEYMGECDRLSYFTVRKEMNELYGCRDIEGEIDKALDANNPMRTEERKVNGQVLLAVSVYQAQSYAESQGAEFKDPRKDVVESLCGIIPEMSAKQFKWNKGRLAYEGIQVSKVVADEEWEKAHPKGSRDKGKGEHGKPKGEHGKPARDPKDPKGGGHDKPQEDKGSQKPQPGGQPEPGKGGQDGAGKDIQDEPLPETFPPGGLQNEDEPEIRIDISVDDIMNIASGIGGDGSMGAGEKPEGPAAPDLEDIPLESLMPDFEEEEFDAL